jgi:hypothetical protein
MKENKKNNLENYTDLLFVSATVLLLAVPLLFVTEFSATAASIFLSLPGRYDSKNASIATSVGLWS